MHRPRHGGPSNPSGEKAQLVLAYQELGNELHSTQLKVIGNYTLGRVIGEGSFGTVRLGIHRLTGSRVAIKHIPKSSSPPLLTREIHHHRRLHHPNVVQLYEVIATEHSIWLITELCAGGELFDYLVEKTHFTEHEARRLFGQICLGLGYVHRQGVVHRDLKLENVLLDERCNPKLADFGFGREFEPRKLLDTYCGTTAYAAPEMLAGKKYLGQEADIWSLGIILHALLTGSLPFDDDDEDQMKAMIMAGHFEIPNFVSNEACNLILSVLQQDPKARPSIERILSHPWFTTPPLQHSFGEPEPLSRPSPILEEAQQLAKSPPISIVTLSPTETPDRSSSLRDPLPAFAAQANKSGHSVLTLDASQLSPKASDVSPGSGRNDTSSPVTSNNFNVEMSTISDLDHLPSDLPMACSTGLHAAPDIAPPPLHKHSNTSHANVNKSEDLPSNSLYHGPTQVEGKSNAKSPGSTEGGAEAPLTSEQSRDPSAQATHLPNFKAKAGSLKPLPLTALANLPSTMSHPQIRTPSRTKRRSIGSTLSERMGPFEDGTPSDLATPTTNQARLSVSSLSTVVIDYVGALKTTTQAPLLSQEDLVFLKSLGSLGFDSGQIIHSVQSYACDSSGALWWILKKKLEQQLINRDEVSSPNPSTIHPLNHQNIQSREPLTTSNVASSSIHASDLTSDSPVPASHQKTSLPDTPEDSPLVTLKFKLDSSSNVSKKPISLAQPVLSITKSQDMKSSSDQIKIEKQAHAPNLVIAEDRSHLNSRGDPAYSKNSSTLTAIPTNLTDDARSSASSTRMDTPSGSDKDTPHIIIDPSSLSKKSNPDLRKRSQSVSMLQRATHALATKKSVDDKHPRIRSREASSTNDHDEKYGQGKISKKDLKAREKESKMEENSKFSSSLPLSGLFSRKTLLPHPLPYLPAGMMSHQTPPGSDKSMDKNAHKLKENDVSLDNSLISSPPSTPSKGVVSHITSRGSSDADLNIPGDDQTHSSALSLHASSSLSHASPQSMPFNNLDAFCTPKPHSSSGRSTIVPPNSKTDDHKSLKESSPAVNSLSEIASSHKSSPPGSEIAQRTRHKSAKGNLFSNFRFWFNEDRRKRKQNVPMMATHSHAGTSRTGRMVGSPGAGSPPAALNGDNDLQIRKVPGDSQIVRSPLGTVAVHRRPSKGSRRSSMQSNLQASLELRNHSASKRRSDSSRASFGSITGTRTPGSERSSHISGSQSTINPSRASSDGHGRSRGPETHGRRTSMSSAGSRRSIAPMQHLAPNQNPIINPIFVRRTSSTGTSVRRVMALGSSSSSSRPRPTKAPSFTSSLRTSISSDEGPQLLNRRASGGPDDHRLHSPVAVHEVEETIEEEDDGGEDDEKETAVEPGRESGSNTDDARRSAFQKLSGNKTVRTQSQSSLEGGSNNQSGNPAGTSTRAIFMAHKPHSVFGTPTQAFFARSTQSPVTAKFNSASSTGTATSYSNLMKSIADGPTSRKSSVEPRLRDVFASKAKEEGEWIDVDDDDDECARYEGGIGQGVKSRSEGTSGVIRTGGADVQGTGISVGTSQYTLSNNNQVSASSMKNPSHVKTSSSTLPPKPSNSFKSASDSIVNSPAASLIGNWRGGNPRVTSNFKSIAIEEEEEEEEDEGK